MSERKKELIRTIETPKWSMTFYRADKRPKKKHDEQKEENQNADLRSDMPEM